MINSLPLLRKGFFRFREDSAPINRINVESLTERMNRSVKRIRRTACFICALLLALCTAAAYAEAETENVEQGVDEIQPLLEMTEVKQQEGMSLEEMTDAVAENAMSEYLDHATGFSMQYPSIFVFNEELPGNAAATADGKATLSIENMENQSGLDEAALTAAIKLESSDAEIRKNEHNGCLRTDRETNDSKTVRTDLYLLTKQSFHHVVICYPAEEKESYFTYIEYMINTMETKGTDLG